MLSDPTLKGLILYVLVVAAVSLVVVIMACHVVSHIGRWFFRLQQARIRAETQKRACDMRLDGRNVSVCPRCVGDGRSGPERVCRDCGGLGIQIESPAGSALPTEAKPRA